MIFNRLKSLAMKAPGVATLDKLLKTPAEIQALLAGSSGRTQKDSMTVDVVAREVTPAPAAKAFVQPVTPSIPAGDVSTADHTEPGVGSRSYQLFTPPQAASGKPLPLVLMLHGCKQNPDDFALGTGMNNAALAQGFFVVYPAQIKKANASNCWNWFEPEHQQRMGGEPQILAGIVQAIAKHHAIDPARVYVAGLSAGGAMAAILGRAWPDVFAAVGVHSGLAAGAASGVASAFGAMHSGAGNAPGGLGAGLLKHMPGFADLPSWSPADAAFAELVGGSADRPIPPTIVFHGDEDKTVNVANGEQVLEAALQSAEESAKAIPQPENTRAHTNGYESTQRIYRNAQGQPIAEHWRIHGAGHAWSGGNPKGSFTDSSGPDATAEMVRFFLAQRLATSP